MESLSLHNRRLIVHIFNQIIESCGLITIWNRSISSVDDYTSSHEGMQTMAASCMLIESIGEGVKKIDRMAPGLLQRLNSDIQWTEIIGLRNHIAHGYFNLDADIIYDVVTHEIPKLMDSLSELREHFECEG